MELKFKKLNPEAVQPTYGSDGAACFDLYGLTEGIVAPGMPLNVSTGLAFEVPEDHVMLVFSRSGMGFNNDTRLANCVGVIDSDYRGEVMVKLTRDGRPDNPTRVAVGDRVAQAMILPVARVTFEDVDWLEATGRSTSGFGSTGA